MTHRTRACLVATASAAALLTPVVGVVTSSPAEAALRPPPCTYTLKHDVILRKHKSVKSTAIGTLKDGYRTKRDCALPTGGHFKGCGGGNHWIKIPSRNAWAPMASGCWRIKTPY